MGLSKLIVDYIFRVSPLHWLDLSATPWQCLLRFTLFHAPIPKMDRRPIWNVSFPLKRKRSSYLCLQMDLISLVNKSNSLIVKRKKINKEALSWQRTIRFLNYLICCVKNIWKGILDGWQSTCIPRNMPQLPL